MGELYEKGIKTGKKHIPWLSQLKKIPSVSLTTFLFIFTVLKLFIYLCSMLCVLDAATTMKIFIALKNLSLVYFEEGNLFFSVGKT